MAGILLGVSSGAYWAIGALAALGALVAGFEHLDVRSAALRGLIAGAVYGVALLLAHAIAGTDAKVSLGDFPPLLAVMAASSAWSSPAPERGSHVLAENGPAASGP